MASPSRPKHQPEPGPAALAGSGGMQPPRAPPLVATADPEPPPESSPPSALLVALDGDAGGGDLELRGAVEMAFVLLATGQRAKGLVRRGQMWFAVLEGGQEQVVAPGASLRTDRGNMRFLLGPNLQEQRMQLAYERATTDEGTGAFTRTYFDAALPKYVQTARRLEEPLALGVLRLAPSADATSQLDRLREVVTELGQLEAAYVVVSRFDRRTLAVVAHAHNQGGLATQLETVLARARNMSEGAATASSVLRPDEDAEELLSRVLKGLPS